ncbi:MAG TPA: DegT/DnrJ/EryC1/StrS aminotransferase family protein [Phycisphaerales bacterium]|nr:DegT/DnrJ/EryC1/StrS aminotransferase family protein [Phycisphaerales bacterium]HMP36581.1 DegT/DnrJ/EryC1/StrS aminotransferase family protein [Phycisphaerales bacterium]
MTQLIPLSSPDIRDEDLLEVAEALRSGRLTLGPWVEQFERMVAHRAGRPFGVAVGSAAAAMAVSLRALGIGPGDEVVTPAFAFAGTAEAILQVGATPRFVDCDPGTLSLDLGAVERAITPRTRCVLAEVVFGNPAGLRELALLCARHEVPLIEDAGGGLGTVVGGEALGRFGRLAIFSFYPNKPVTTGEGAVIVTHDDRLADLCRSLRNHGRPSREAPRSMHSPGLGSALLHERLGWSCRMSDLNAALGLSQLRRLDEIMHLRQCVADGYLRRLMDKPDIILPTIPPETRMSWSVWVVRLSDRFTSLDRDEIIAGLRRHDIGACNYYPPVPMLPAFRKLAGHEPGSFPMAESASQRTIALPFHNRLTEREQDLVCQTLDVMMQRTAFARQ